MSDIKLFSPCDECKRGPSEECLSCELKYFESFKTDAEALRGQVERMRGHLDDACECARCCECSGMVDDCRIMATKKFKAENGG